MTDFEKELQYLLNRFSKENGSNTPDFILAEYLNNCLITYNKALQQREKWYGRDGFLQTPEGVSSPAPPGPIEMPTQVIKKSCVYIDKRPLGYSDLCKYCGGRDVGWSEEYPEGICNWCGTEQ